MEMEEIQNQGCSKFQRISNGNGRIDSSAKIAAAHKGDDQYPDDEDDGEVKRSNGGGGGARGLNISSTHGVGSLCGWPSSRIVRVSRASGGKDRHSKVLTSKGLRDRRVRLSVNTAIQFYDLQDRLGCDQPSKAVEWLLKAAAPSIAELPSLNPPFTDGQQLSDERRSSAGLEQALDSADIEMEGDQNMQQHGSLSKSCSSTSETSKGSGGLSLSRSESRIKARERARERAAEKEKEKENETSRGVSAQHHQNLNPISSSFTELLTGTTSPNASVHQTRGGDTNFFAKSPRQWSSTPMDYFTTGLLCQSSTRAMDHSSSGFPGNIHVTNPLHQPQLASVSSPLFNMGGELQQFSFVSDHLAPVVTAAAGSNSNNHQQHSSSNNNNNEYNLNFSISPSSSSGLAGFNRGTLQSNSSSPSLLPHFQRYPPLDGSPPSFFTIAAATTSAPNAASVDTNHQQHFLSGFDARLQLYYGDGHAARHSDQKGKGKN